MKKYTQQTFFISHHFSTHLPHVEVFTWVIDMYVNLLTYLLHGTTFKSYWKLLFKCFLVQWTIFFRFSLVSFTLFVYVMVGIEFYIDGFKFLESLSHSEYSNCAHKREYSFYLKHNSTGLPYLSLFLHWGSTA